MIRAVIDTNVVVSGLPSPAGNEALIILLTIHQGLVHPVPRKRSLQKDQGIAVSVLLCGTHRSWADHSLTKESFQSISHLLWRILATEAGGEATFRVHHID